MVLVPARSARLSGDSAGGVHPRLGRPPRGLRTARGLVEPQLLGAPQQRPQVVQAAVYHAKCACLHQRVTERGRLDRAGPNTIQFGNRYAWAPGFDRLVLPG